MRDEALAGLGRMSTPDDLTLEALISQAYEELCLAFGADPENLVLQILDEPDQPVSNNTLAYFEGRSRLDHGSGLCAPAIELPGRIVFLRHMVMAYLMPLQQDLAGQVRFVKTVLAHELAHVYGWSDEELAARECYWPALGDPRAGMATPDDRVEGPQDQVREKKFS